MSGGDSMYSILLKEDNILTVTNEERVMQRSNLVDDLQFVVETMYKDKDMSEYTVQMEYVLPVSREVHSEILTLKEEQEYEDFLVYQLPFDSRLTVEAGKIELYLTFVNVDMDSEGEIKEYVRKTSSCFINIIPISKWGDYIPDESLSAIDQRLLMVNAQIKALNDMMDVLLDNSKT